MCVGIPFCGVNESTLLSVIPTKVAESTDKSALLSIFPHLDTRLRGYDTQKLMNISQVNTHKNVFIK